MLKSFTHLFVQTENSKRLLAGIGFSENVSVSGDTRFDRVIEIAENFKPIHIIDLFCKNNKVIIAGSTWEEDEEAIYHFANSHPDIKFIIAPHEISESHLENLKKLFKNYVLFSDYEMRYNPATMHESSNENHAHILIIDNIGMLSKLYNYATITYVGGGFGDSGVHNVLEAAVYGKPVIIGPVYEKYVEAYELVEAGGAITVSNALELEEELNNLLGNEGHYSRTCRVSKNYVYSKKGATQQIMKLVKELSWQKSKTQHPGI